MQSSKGCRPKQRGHKKTGISLLFDEESACRAAFSMSSGSYSGLTMQELVRRNWKEFMTAPKTLSFWKAEE
jgi:hypothetical protein